MFSQMLKVGKEVNEESARAVLASSVREIERNQYKILQATKVRDREEPVLDPSGYQGER